MSGLQGTTLGRYQIIERLGRGGMSEVYLAYDEQMHRHVAVKVVVNGQTEYIERFRREAEAIGRLTHDHILPAFDYGEQDMYHYLVMPYIEYGTLRDLIAQGPLPIEHVAELLEQIASALQFAHQQGIIHRDIKPSNILLRDDHYLYLADFGLAKVIEGGSDLTQFGSLLGTPEYMSPELSSGPATTSSDIYALGVLVYQMVTGTVPFIGDTPLSVYWKQIQEAPTPPTEINPNVPYAIELVILTALEKDPALRYQTPLDLSTAFQRALAMPDDEAMKTMGEPVYEALEEDFVDAPIQEYTQGLPEQEEMLVLPGNPAVAPTATATATARRKRFSKFTRSSLPPMPPLRSLRHAIPRSTRRNVSGPMDTVPEMNSDSLRTQAPADPAIEPTSGSYQTIVPSGSSQSQPLAEQPQSSRLLIMVLIGIIILLLIAIIIILVYASAHRTAFNPAPVVQLLNAGRQQAWLRSM